MTYMAEEKTTTTLSYDNSGDNVSSGLMQKCIKWIERKSRNVERQTTIYPLNGQETMVMRGG